MIRFLFVYGTLHPKLAPACVAHAVKQMRKVGHATTRGLLYDLGPYPGAKFSENATTEIHGGVYRLPRSFQLIASILNDLDEYEAIDPKNPAGALFVRKPVQVKLRNGRRLTCWAYEFNRSCEEASLIQSGKYTSRQI